MFEPENDIERLLMRASAEPAERPAFARALMDAEIFVVLVPEGGDPIVPGPDGKRRYSRGHQDDAAERDARRGKADPVLHRADRGRKPGTGTTTLWRRTRTRDLFARYPGAPFVLNPGSDYGKDYTPGEVTADCWRAISTERPAGCHDAGAAADLAGASQAKSQPPDRGARRANSRASNPSAAPG